jgi:holliday junction DNA helicase RuvB
MTEKKNELIDSKKIEEDKNNLSIRPKKLSQFIGQDSLKSNLNTFIESSLKRKKVLDHIIFYGPPGLGKTTLANIVSYEKNVNIHITSGPAFTKKGDLVTLLSNLSSGDILFIDEIHRLSPVIEETLYPAMEDFKCDYIIGAGPSARTMQISIEQFTLIGATTRLGLISRPLRDRFGIPMQLDFYKPIDLKIIINQVAKNLEIKIEDSASMEIAIRSRGTPRISIRLLKRAIDFSIVENLNYINLKIVKQSLQKLKIDNLGLDEMDIKYLSCIANNFRGGPVGVENISAALLEEKDIIEDVVEPFLIQQGLIQRTSRGRILSEKGFKQLGIISD